MTRNAIIGRQPAISDFVWSRLKGVLASLLRALIHIYSLAGVQHSLLVALPWLRRYATYDRLAGLIFGLARRADWDDALEWNWAQACNSFAAEGVRCSVP